MLLILTNWNEFSGLDFKKIGDLMKNKIIVDGRNMYSPDEMKEHGFRYISIGRREV